MKTLKKQIEIVSIDAIEKTTVVSNGATFKIDGNVIESLLPSFDANVFNTLTDIQLLQVQALFIPIQKVAGTIEIAKAFNNKDISLELDKQKGDTTVDFLQGMTPYINVWARFKQTLDKSGEFDYDIYFKLSHEQVVEFYRMFRTLSDKMVADKVEIYPFVAELLVVLVEYFLPVND